MKIINSIFGFILTILLVFGIVYFTVPSVKDKIDGSLFKEPVIEQPVEDENEGETTEDETNEDPSNAGDDTEDETNTDEESDNVQQEHEYPAN